MLLVIRKQDNFYNKNKMKMYLLILCIMVALFYNSLGVCGKPTRTNYIHSISKLSFKFYQIWGKTWYSSDTFWSWLLSFSFSLSLSCGGRTGLRYYGNCRFLKQDTEVSIKISTVFCISNLLHWRENVNFTNGNLGFQGKIDGISVYSI